MLRSKKNVVLKNLVKFIIGPFGSAFTVENYTNDETYRYIRGKDVKPLMLLETDNVYMPELDFKRLEKYSLQEKDILISVVGTNGNSAMVQKSQLPAIFSCKSTAIRAENINSSYLLIYLNTNYVKKYLEMSTRGAVQTGLNLSDLETIPIISFSDAFQSTIEKFYVKSLQKVESSKELYCQAEKVFLEGLGLENYELSGESIVVKKLSSSFIESGRLDAEYYQTKYENFINKMGDFLLLQEVCNVYDSNYNPIFDKEYKYIELSDVDQYGNIAGYTQENGKALPTRAKRIVKANNVIVSSIEGSLDKCALIREEHNNSLCSTGFYVIDSPIINSETLLVMFKSNLMNLLLKRYCSGTILTSISKEDFLKIPIPKISNIIQKEISDKIKKSSILKEQSEQLLKIAVRAVEIAIEKTEEGAIKYLEKEMKKLNIEI